MNISNSSGLNRLAPTIVGKVKFGGKEGWKITANEGHRTVFLSPKSASVMDRAMVRFEAALKSLADK